ncbi:MAG: glycosyltransferase, partial [Muribaculaceae bacterium]|nr:glycosyltransferase [Muribaculaceae bacterium]
MKILILLRWFPFLGGTESISVSLANQLAEGDADIFIFGQKLPGVNVDFELAEGVSVVTVDEPLSPENTCRVIRRLNIDYVLFQCPFPAQLAIAEAIVKSTDARLFVTLHDDPLHAMAAQWPVKANSSRLSLVVKRMAWPLYRLWADNRGKRVMSRYIRSADRLILLSPAYERALSEALNLPEECRRKLISIPNFLPESAFPQETAAKRKEMVYVGRVVELQKRLSRLVRIWKMFEERHDDWTLRIVGDGDDLDSLKRYAADLEVGGISFEGYSCDVRSFLKPASVVVLVSDSEGLPMSLIEAMAEG